MKEPGLYGTDLGITTGPALWLGRRDFHVPRPINTEEQKMRFTEHLLCAKHLLWAGHQSACSA